MHVNEEKPGEHCSPDHLFHFAYRASGDPSLEPSPLSPNLAGSN